MLKISLNDNDEKNNYKKSFIQYYTSQNYLDRIGYYYIPLKNLDKKKLLYCPYENTMNIYFGEFDLSEGKMLPSVDNKRLLILDQLNYTLFNGITIITENENIKYFFQFGEIEDSILDNLKIDNFKSDINMNKEIILDDNIKELYFFNIYHFNNSFVLDINTIYGNVSVEYLSLDGLSINDKNFYNIFPFNKELLNTNIKIIKEPTLINMPKIEVIRIINNHYTNSSDSNVLFKAFLFINKYTLFTEIEENQLMPLFLPSEEFLVKYKVNLNSFTGEMNYKFFFNKLNLLNENNNYNISITLNNESFYLSQKYNNIFQKGIASIVRYNLVKIENICQQNILLWTQIGKLDENEYNIFYASERAFHGVMTTGTIYLFIFDYNNIINKKDLGLYPYKFVFNLEKPVSNKCIGYYHQSLVNKNIKASNTIFKPNNINSIYYELKNSGDNISFSDKINLDELTSILTDKLYFYTLIQQVNGYLLVDFHFDYKYDLTDKKNDLVSFEYDESIYSINYKLADDYKNKYLLFQVLTCQNPNEFNVNFFKENSDIFYSLNSNDDNGDIEKITKDNIFGYIHTEQIKNEDRNNSYINIVKPGKLFFRYSYTNSKVDINLIKSLRYESKYQSNINIEKKRKVENKDIFSISFDCFLKNTITNYFILTLSDEEDDIVNECHFLSYLYNYKNKEKKYLLNKRMLNEIYYKKYLSFKDEGTSDRISKEITFEAFGNYKVYILAEELENYSLYKLLGVKTYSYINEGNDEIIKEEEKKENEVSYILIALIILLSLLIIILSAFIIYHYVRKENINQIISFMNLPNKDSINLSKNNMLLSIISNKSDDDNCPKNNLFFPILNEIDMEKEEENDKNSFSIINNKNNNFDNYDNYDNNNNNNNEDVLDDEILDIDEDKGRPPPPPITAVPPETRIAQMVNELRRNKSNNNEIYNKENMYTNDGSYSTDNGE